MIYFYQTAGVFFFLCGCGCLFSACYLWRKRMEEHTGITKKVKRQEQEQTTILQKEWEECIWKITHQNDTELL